MLRSVALALLALSSCGLAVATPPTDFDGYIAHTLKTFEVPGAAIALVEPGKPALTRGYGVPKLGSADRVDEHTVFSIASNSKAFTATALAMLVDEGKLSWDDKVVDRLPGFRMYDAYTTHEMTIRDLLTHRSGLGLGAGDLLFWPGSTFSREEIVHRLRYIKPATSFRSSYAYDNVLYIVAGEVVAAVSGQSWESFIVQRIFAPLGMKDAAPVHGELKTTNRSWPHARLSGPARGFGEVEPLDKVPRVDNAGPAGGINASAADMAQWVRLQLDRGVWNGNRLFSEAAARELWTPQVIVPLEPTPAVIVDTAANFWGYALGFNVRDYRGHRIIAHEGWLEGAISLTYLIPEKNVGFIVMMNSEEAEARYAIAYRLLDHYLGLPRRDWIAPFVKVRDERLADARRVLEKRTSGEAAGNSNSSSAKWASATTPSQASSQSGPSLPLASYAGTYLDTWYGTVTISAQADSLAISFDHTPGMSGALEHVRYDTFRTRFADRRMEDAYLTFSLRADGSIDHIQLEAVSPLADFSFDYADLLLRPAPAPQ